MLRLPQSAPLREVLGSGSRPWIEAKQTLSQHSFFDCCLDRCRVCGDPVKHVGSMTLIRPAAKTDARPKTKKNSKTTSKPITRTTRTATPTAFGQVPMDTSIEQLCTSLLVELCFRYYRWGSLPSCSSKRLRAVNIAPRAGLTGPTFIKPVAGMSTKTDSTCPPRK